MLILICNSVIALWYGWCLVRQWKKINRIHERALRIDYQDVISTFEELLNEDNSVKIHTQNLQILATEMFKIKNRIAQPSLEDVF